MTHDDLRDFYQKRKDLFTHRLESINKRINIISNLRLAVRRAMTDRPIDTDYSPDGNVPPKQFEQVFARQVAALGRAGDILFLHTTSGASPNLHAAARAAREQGVITVGMLGRTGGPLRELVDHDVARRIPLRPRDHRIPRLAFPVPEQRAKPAGVREDVADRHDVFAVGRELRPVLRHRRDRRGRRGGWWCGAPRG